MVWLVCIQIIASNDRKITPCFSSRVQLANSIFPCPSSLSASRPRVPGTAINTGNAIRRKIYGTDSLVGTRKKHILHFTMFLAQKSLHQMAVPTRVKSVTTIKYSQIEFTLGKKKSGLSSTMWIIPTGREGKRKKEGRGGGRRGLRT